jgi:hypothetical protein
VDPRDLHAFIEARRAQVLKQQIADGEQDLDRRFTDARAPRKAG